MAMTIDEFIFEQVSQLKHGFPEPGIVVRIDVNSVT